jgi:hypothetical protein
MDFLSLFYLLVLASLGWYWLSSIHVLEIARKAGRNACDKAGVQFLDDTVASTRINIARNLSGRRALRRTYRFEFTETGNTRIEGKIVMLGDAIESVTMDPYQILE